jgi:septal ring factor EnvC (AmiA/AmiB activator)
MKMGNLNQVKEDFKARNSFDELVSNDECKISIQSYDWLIEQAEKVEELEKENESLTSRFHRQAEYIINLEAMLESSQANVKAWVKKYEQVAGEIETYKCGSCGLIHRTTRDKMTFDLECVGHECYGTMKVIKNIENENDKMSSLEITLSAMNITMHDLLNERDNNRKEIEGLRISLEAERGFIQNRKSSVDDCELKEIVKMANLEVRELIFLLEKWSGGQGMSKEEMHYMQRLLESTLKFVLTHKQ